jgi:AcrR family transcriptional regulator
MVQSKRLKWTTKELNEQDVEPSLDRKILAVSRLHFLKYGFSKVRMDELAAELGISKKTLYNYFVSKEELLRAVLRDFANEVEHAHTCVDDSSCDSFVSGIRVFVITLSEMLREISQQFVRDLLRTAPHLWTELGEWRSSAIDTTFTKLLVQGQKVGAIRTDFPAHQLSQTYRVVVDSALTPEVLAMTKFSAVDIYRSVVNALFVGILTDQARQEFRTSQGTVTTKRKIKSSSVVSSSLQEGYK